MRTHWILALSLTLTATVVGATDSEQFLMRNLGLPDGAKAQALAATGMATCSLSPRFQRLRWVRGFAQRRWIGPAR